MRRMQVTTWVLGHLLGSGQFGQVVGLGMGRFVVDCHLQSSLCFEDFGVNSPRNEFKNKVVSMRRHYEWRSLHKKPGKGPSMCAASKS